MAIDTRPQVVDVTHYAGDTLTIKITVPAGLADGFVWSAQVRADRTVEGPPDASFTVIQPTAPGDPGWITLTSADCSRLAGLGELVRKRARDGTVRMVKTYQGQWDCEASPPAGGDPVITFAQGSLTIDLDVTRTP